MRWLPKAIYYTQLMPHRALGVALLTLIPALVTAQEPAVPQIPIIVTHGEGVVRRAPDQAFVVASVETRAKNPKEAQTQNANIMTAVQQRIAGLGIPKDAIRTLGYNIQQEYDFPNGRRVLRDYVARNALEIRVDAIDKVGDVLDGAVQAGATSVSNVRFELKDRTAAEREALRLAVADARGRADAAATGAGRAVDRVLKIDDSPDAGGPIVPRQMTMARMAADAAPETPIEPGTIEIRTRVTLTVSIK